MKTISWYKPQPRQKPIRLPRRQPIKVVPSGIGDQDIVGNWLMYYLKGGDHLHDFSPEDNHGTLKNDTAWVDGSYGWALDFDGSGNYVNVESNTSLNVETGSFTIGAWVKPIDVDDREIIISKRGVSDGDDASQFTLIIDGDGTFVTTDHLDFYWADSGGTVHHHESGSAINYGEWSYVVAAFNPSTDEWNIYINGELDNSGTETNDPVSDTDPITIGAKTAADGSIFGSVEGKMKMVRLYEVEKSSSWISRRFARTKGVFF